MKKDEIIIDGVDVSGCRYLFDDTSYKRSKTSCSITLKDCKYLGDNCYYKQLQRLKEIKDDFFKQAEISHQAVLDKNNIIEKLETIIQEIKQLVSTDYIQNKKELVQNYDFLDNFMQKIEDKCNEVNND